MRKPDLMETIVSSALDSAGVPYVTETDPRANRLDFYLTEADVHIECKLMHTDRIAEQMSRVKNVIVLQGELAARLFAQAIILGMRNARAEAIMENER